MSSPDVVTTECFCVVCVYISIVDLFTKSFGVSVPFFDEVHVFLFLFPLFVVLLDSLGQTHSPSRVYMDALRNVSAEKKKRRKKLEKNKRIKKVVVFVQIFFFLSRQKNTDTERSGQRIKSLFFILYICMEIKIPVCCIALLYKSNVLVAFF